MIHKWKLYSVALTLVYKAFPKTAIIFFKNMAHHSCPSVNCCFSHQLPTLVSYKVQYNATQLLLGMSVKRCKNKTGKFVGLQEIMDQQLVKMATSWLAYSSFQRLTLAGGQTCQWSGLETTRIYAPHGSTDKISCFVSCWLLTSSGFEALAGLGSPGKAEAWPRAWMGFHLQILCWRVAVL